MNSEAPRKDKRRYPNYRKKNFRRNEPAAPADLNENTTLVSPENLTPQIQAAEEKISLPPKDNFQQKKNPPRGNRNSKLKNFAGRSEIAQKENSVEIPQEKINEENSPELKSSRKNISSQEKPDENSGRNDQKKQNFQQKKNFPPQHKHEKRQPSQRQEHHAEKKFLPPMPLDVEENFTAQRIISVVENYLTKELFVEDGSRICVGVSGGVDSIVLLDILAVLAQKRKYFVVVAHGNHNLRGKSSNDDEHFVRNLSRRYGFYFHHSTLHVKQQAEKYSQSIELAARSLRYKFFERVSKESRADFLATAHSADDVAETFFLNLFRGAGLTGLSAIPPRRPLTKRTLVVRPLLPLRKAEIIEYAKSRNLEWREDETNSLYLYTRNKIRHLLLPKIEEEFSSVVVEQINRSVRLLQGADEVIRERVEHLMPLVISEFANERCFLKISILEGLNDFMKGEIFEEVLKTKFKSQSAPFTIIERVIRLLDSEVGSVAEISKQIQAIREREHILIVKKKNFSEKNIDVMKEGEFSLGNQLLTLKEIPREKVKFTDDPNVEFFDADVLPYRLMVRNWRAGDSFQPLGMGGTMKLSDFLTNEKISSIDRPDVFVMTTGSDQIVWVLGQRIDDRFKVGNDTTRVIRAELRPSQKSKPQPKKEQDAK